MVEKMKTYEVMAQPAGRYWALEVPEIDRVTQARNVKEIELMARDLIEIMTETTDFDVDIRLKLPATVDDHRRRAKDLRVEELRLRSEAAQEMRAAAHALRDAGLTLRDVGTLLDVSTARAGQLVGTGGPRVQSPGSKSQATTISSAKRSNSSLGSSASSRNSDRATTRSS